MDQFASDSNNPPIPHLKLLMDSADGTVGGDIYEMPEYRDQINIRNEIERYWAGRNRAQRISTRRAA